MSSQTPKSTEYYLKAAQKLIKGQVDSDRLRRFDTGDKSSVDMLRQLKEEKLNNSKQSTKKQQIPESFPRNLKTEDMGTLLKIYSKSKFESGVMARPSGKSNNERLLEQQTEKIRERAAHQRKEQQRIHEQIAESLKKFDQSKNRTLPIGQINRECFRSTLLRDQEESWQQFRSVKEEIQDSRVKIGENRNLTESRMTQEQLEGEFEFESQSQMEYQKNFQTKRQKGLADIFSRDNGKILQILQAFIKQIALRTESIEALHSKKQQKTSDELSIQYNPILPQRQPTPHPLFFSPQTQTFLFKYTPEFLSTNDHFFPAEVVTQHDAYKRSGRTSTFHPRHFTMSGEQLLYFGDDYEKVKKITVIIPQKIELVPFKKTEGKFWNKQEKEISMFTIRGMVKEERKDIMIESDGLEGVELYQELVEFFAIKAYNIYCCNFRVVENRFQPFLRDREHHILDLSNDCLKMDNCTLDREICVEYFEIWMKLLEFNKNLKKVDLSNSHLRVECTECILKSLTKQSLNLTSLDISNNKLSLESLKTYATCFQQYPGIQQLSLSRCSLNNQSFDTFFSAMPLIFSRLVLIDLSYNHLTQKSLPLLLKILHKFNGVFKGDGLELGRQSIPQLLRLQLNTLSMNKCNILIDNHMMEEIVSKLINNVSLKTLLLRGNKCEFEYELLMMLMADCKCIEEVGLDIPKHYIFKKANPNTEWEIDLS